MRHRDAPRLTLTNRLLALAAAIVVVTTLLLIGTSAFGVYDMAVSQASARKLAYREMVLSDLEGRMGSAGRIVRIAAMDQVFMSAEQRDVRRALSALGADNPQAVTGAVLISATGEELARWPVGDDGLDLHPRIMPGAPVEGLSFEWIASDAQAEGSLWAVAPVRLPEGPPRLLVVRLDTGFVDEALGDVARVAGGVAAIVVDEDGHPLFAGEGATWADASSIVADPDEVDPTTGKLAVTGERSLVGYYADMSVPPGPVWRVAVVGPEDDPLKETWSALRSGMVGWVVALGAALLASLAVVSRVTRPLRQLEIRARALASGAAVEPAAVEHHDEVGRLLEAFNSVGRRLDRLGDIAELLARASDRERVLAGVTSSITHMLGAVDVGLFLLSGRDQLDLVSAEGVLHGRDDARVVLGDVPWIGRALIDGEPVVDMLTADDVLVGMHGYDEAAVLAAPLRAGDEIIGAIAVVRPGTRGFAESEAETVRSFAAQASVALHNSRLFDEERQSRRESEALRAMAERLASPLAIDDTLGELGRTAADLLGFEGAVVSLLEPDRFGLPEAGAVDDADSWIALWRRAADASAADGLPLMLEGAGPEGPFVQRLAGGTRRSALLVPLVVDEDPAGVLVLLSDELEPQLSAHHLEIAGTVGKQASIALKNAYLYEQATRRADNIETIFRISQAVASSLESRIVLNRVLDVVQKILSADAVMLLTYDAQRKVMTVAMARGVLHRDMLDIVFRPGEDVPGRVFETREPERFDRLAGTDTRLLNAAVAQDLNSLLAVPLLARGKSIGVLAAFARAEAAFSNDELDLLRTFASQAALAIDTADMFSREHHVSSVLQQSILPSRLPRVPGIDASSVYLPAVGDAEIGGDYYDLFTAPDGRVVVTIGDVCGKGVEAATKTSMIKYAIRGMVVAGLDPERVLAELNAMLMETGDAGNIVTLWIGYLDTTTGALSYANAGHPPALVLDPATGRIARLETTGALLGAVGDTDWAQASLEMTPGGTLLLYTDGVTEARSGARFFGEGRVRRGLRAGGSAAGVTQRVLALVQRFASGDLRDDAAIVAVVWTG